MTRLRHEQSACTVPPCKDTYTASDSPLRQLELENARLRMVIAELLMKNQKLRWKLQEQ